MASVAFGEEELTTSAQDDEARWMDRPTPAPCERGAAVQSTSDLERIMAETKETDEIETGHAVPTSQRDSGVKSGLPDDLILEISAGIQNQDQCMGLALLLKIDHDEMLRALHTTFDTRTAFTIIKKWMKRYPEHATGRALYCALCDIGRQDLADKSKDRLLQRGDLDIQSEREVMHVAGRASTLVDLQQPRHLNLQLQDGLIANISTAFNNHNQCIKLAIKLRLEEDEIMKLFDSTFSDRMAYDIIKQWMEARTDQATGPALYSALRDIGLTDLADQIQEKLCYRGDVQVEVEKEVTAPVEQDPPIPVKKSRVGGDSCPDDELLQKIGKAVSSHEQCVQLALKLKIGDDDVYKVVDATFTETLAHEVLKKWVEAHDEKATGSVLQAALLESGRRDLAERFEDQLLRKDIDLDQSTRQAVEVANTKVTAKSDSTETEDVQVVLPSVELLNEIASNITKLKHCVRLAESLDFSEDFVKHLREGQFRSTTALDILYKWRQLKSKQATGKVLFDALISMKRRDIAACYAEGLLGQDNIDWEDLCYDDKHRDFFRLLRRRGIDVFAIFERMSCSEYFLGCLHQEYILTGPEYDELMHFSKSQVERSLMNKKLLDVINQKRSQVQEMFADQLCFYQAKFVMIDEEPSASSDPSQHREHGSITSIPCEIQGGDILLDFKKRLIRQYNPLLIVRPLDFAATEHIQSVSEMYITLSSISYEEALKLVGGPGKLRDKELLKAASRIDAESKHSQELVDIHSLLCPHLSTQEKSALLFGSAGSGKTLTTLKILSEWNSKETTSPFQQFDVIVYVTGKERARLRAKDIHEFWRLEQMGFNEKQQQFILNHYSSLSEKVLFLIDGWDEGGDDDLLQGDSALRKILQRDTFPQSAVIITTRPAPNVHPLLETCRHRYSLVGFNDSRLQELFHQRLEESQASKLYSMLRQSSHVHVKSAVQKTPLFAAMLVEVYKRNETLPLTVTALFQLMLDSLRSRYVERMKLTRAGSRSDMMFYDGKPANREFDEAEGQLSTLALAGMICKQVTFTRSEVTPCGEDVIKPQFGLLSQVQEVGKHDGDVLFYFSHMTWQEFLAARCLATDPDFIRKLRMCVRSIGWGEHTHLFWRFLAGLVDSQLVPDLVFELLQASGVSGRASWETEVRLLLLECVAENIRMKQLLSDPSDLDKHIRLAAAMIAARQGYSALTDSILDINHLSSIAVVLQHSENITRLELSRCRVDHTYTPFFDALQYLEVVRLHDVYGQESAIFIQTIFSSLRSSHAIAKIHCTNLDATDECMLALSELINVSQSLTKVYFSECKIGTQGLATVSESSCQSLSLSDLSLESNDLSGAGAYIAQICSKLTHLQDLRLSRCNLNDDDFADVLAGLQDSYIEHLHVEKNQLTDDLSLPLLQFATRRSHLHQLRVASFPGCIVYVGGNELSDGIVVQFAFQLPAMCAIEITDGRNTAGHAFIEEQNWAEELRKAVENAHDGHVNFTVPGLGDHGAIQVGHFLKAENVSRLETLILSMCNIGDSGVTAIAKALPRTRLQGLDLSGNSFSYEGFHQMMASLAGGSLLHYLNVAQNPIFTHDPSAGQWSPSALTLAQSVRLGVLCMSATSTSDEFVSFENSLLAVMAIPSLYALDLSNNGITDKSIPMITRYMKDMEYLSLSGNRISSAGGKVLVDIIETWKEGVEAEEQSACCLKRLWLGCNNFHESLFAEWSSEVITSASLSVADLNPEAVLSMFSSFASGSSFHRHLPSPMGEPYRASPFLNRVKRILLTPVFLDFMDYVISENDSECFDRWFMRGVCALAYQSDSENAVNVVRSLANVFTLLTRWYLARKQHIPCLAVCCCKICVLDELLIASPTSNLERMAEKTLQQITQLCVIDRDYLLLMVQYMYGLAERCRLREQLAVADCILQQMEYLYQQACSIMHGFQL